jgi:predicted permease
MDVAVVIRVEAIDSPVAASDRPASTAAWTRPGVEDLGRFYWPASSGTSGGWREIVRRGGRSVGESRLDVRACRWRAGSPGVALMGQVLLKLLPVVIGMAGGFTLRRIGLVDHRDGESVFKLVFYVFLPAVMLTSLSTVTLEKRFAIYPAAAAVVIAAGYLGGRLVAARAKFNPMETGVLLSGCMIVNTGFQLPFVQVLYGAEGVARIAAFDVVNTTATFTLAYLMAVRGNPVHGGGSVLLGRLVKSPALYAIAAGLLVNVTGVTVPAALADPLAKLGAVTAVIIPIGIGILFDPLGGSLRKAGLVVVTRLVTGLVVAGAIVVALGLSGVDRTVLLLIGAAPLVFAVVTFASLENLDVRMATSALSLSLGVSLALSLLIILVTV